jgi:hypothetical protein
MQTKGGGKHDILLLGRPGRDHARMYVNDPRDPDADMCPGATTASVSTEECMARPSFTTRGSGSPPSERSHTLSRATAGSCIIK